MNLKPKIQPVWHELFHKDFVAVYIALALVLLINQVVFTYVLTDRDKVKAFINNSSSFVQAITNLGDQTVAAGATNVTLAEFFLPDSVFFNDNIVCNSNLSGNPCLTALDVNGAIIADYQGSAIDDDGLSYLWQLDPNGLFNNTRFQSADHVCANSDTAPTCVYIDVDGDSDCTTGTQQYIVQPHQSAGPFEPIVCANTGSTPDVLISGSVPWLHSEEVNNNGKWDYCGDANTPGCADNAGSTLRYEDALCGGSTADTWEPSVEPIWDDINSNDQYDSGEPIYWDPATCLIGSGTCSGWEAGCTGNGSLASSGPLPSPFYPHGTVNTTCVFDDLNQNSLMDGLETEIRGACTVAVIYNSLWGEGQTETIWLSTATADTAKKTAVQSPMCYHGQDLLADCDGGNSSLTGDCETISTGDVLTPLTGSEYLCTDNLTNPINIFTHSGYTTLCDTTDGTWVDLRNASAPATTYTVVGSNWSFRDSNGNGTWQAGEGLYYNPNGPSGSPGATFTGPVPFGVGSGYVYPAWTGNEGFVDNEVNPNNFFDGTEPVIIDWNMDGVYTAPVDIIYIDQSDVPAYGDTLYDITAADNVCADSNDLASATCVYTDTDGTPCDGTVTSGRYYLGGACALNTDSLIVTGDNWAVTDNVIDTTTDFLKESVDGELIDSNTDTDIYSTGGLVGGESIIYFDGPLGDLIFVNGSDVEVAGDTLRVVDDTLGVPDQVCSDTSGAYSLATSTCIYVDAGATTPCSSGDGTISYLRGSGCATLSDHQVVAADGWVTNEDGITPVDASSDLILEIGPNPGIFDLNNTGSNYFPIYRVESTEIPGLACDDALWEDNGNTISGPVSLTLGNEMMDVGGSGFDYLNALALKNIGSAINSRDITNVRVYTDWWLFNLFGNTSDGRCTGHTGDLTDDQYTTMSFKNDGSWVTNYNNDVSNLYLGFVRACIVADIAPTAIDGKTIALQFPQLADSGTTGLYNSGDLGLFSYTGNNGLTGGAFTVPYTITISSANPDIPPSYSPPTADTTAPGLLTDIAITANSSGTVHITWKDPTDTDLKQIVIDERVGNLSGGLVVAKGVQQLSLSGKIVGTTYQYRLRAEDNSGNIGEGQYYSVTIPASGEVTLGTPALPAPTPTPTLILQDPAPAGPLPVNVSIGELVKAATSGTIYFIDQDNRRHTFPNEKVYFSYYPDFNGLQILPDATLAAIPLGSNVTMRPGTWLVKIQSDFKVYAVEPYGVLRWISSEAVAAGLYGATWSTRVVDVEPTFFTDYQMGSVVTANIHPTGSIFSYLNDPRVYYVDQATKRFISSAVFVNNKFQNKFVIRNVSTDIAYASGADFPGLNMDAIITLK